MISSCYDWKCGSGKIGSKSQGWKCRSRLH